MPHPKVAYSVPGIEHLLHGEEEVVFADAGYIGADTGQSVLIIGAGGVGSIGIQLAKAAGLVVIATASRPEAESWVKELAACRA